MEGLDIFQLMKIGIHPIKPHSPYTKSKFLAENICEYYSADDGINVVTLRPFCLYGPNNKEGSLIPKIVSAIYDNESLGNLWKRNEEGFSFHRRLCEPHI